MDTFTFKALGTEWTILSDGMALTPEIKKRIIEYAADFEKRFSRFQPDTEVNAFRNAKGGVYVVSDEFARLLERAAHVRTLTKGVYDPAVGGLLERAGYGGKHAESDAAVEDFTLPEWSIVGTSLSLSGPAAFDLGGIGKGYCIDRVSDILRDAGYEYFLVDGGGDMYATKKSDGSGWRVAIEYPGKPDTAAGLVTLKDKALAVSDSFRRRWGKWHHLLHPKKKTTADDAIGCAAVANDAWAADCMTSGLCFSEPDDYNEVAAAFGAKYLAFRQNGQAHVSYDWEGELY